MLNEYEFHNRRPSKLQVMSCVKNGIKDQSTVIHITWGENRIRLERNSVGSAWYGSGWIKTLSGDDIARDLNRSESQSFIDNHFQYIAIR